MEPLWSNLIFSKSDSPKGEISTTTCCNFVPKELTEANSAEWILNHSNTRGQRYTFHPRFRPTDLQTDREPLYHSAHYWNNTGVLPTTENDPDEDFCWSEDDGQFESILPCLRRHFTFMQILSFALDCF